MTIEESYETIGEDLDWLENLDGVPLEDLRGIRRALGHDVEASEQEFLTMLRQRGLLMTDTELLDVNEALREREDRIAKLEAALREYADRRNWRVGDSSSGYLDRWIGDDGPTIAEVALATTAA